MIINGINFPAKILQAMHDNKLVVFAGAGVSISEPTSLPSFKDLVNRVVTYSGVEFDSEENRMDEYLGDRERADADIKRFISDQLKPINNEPNNFHFNILNLFADSNSIRIVTTNQDLMFEEAAKIKGLDTEFFYSPAIPYGNDFNGIVHLHGSIRDYKHIIVTDTDFGHAYMTNGYAARFLVDLFSKYTVLFIGYSYDDLIVRYLTTAITAKNISNAYVLFDDNDKINNFVRAGIEPIFFSKGSYEQECIALGLLGKYLHRGVLDWKKRLELLDGGKPPIDQETDDEIFFAISKEPQVLQFLCEKANSKEWLYWFDEHHLLDGLFTQNGESTSSDRILAEWLVKNYLHDGIIELVEKYGMVSNDILCRSIIMEFEKDGSGKDHSNELFGIYVSLIRGNIKSSYEKGILITIAEKRGMYELMWSLFWDYCDSMAVLGNNYGIPNKASSFNSYSNQNVYHWLKSLWDDVLSKHIVNPLNVVIQVFQLIEQIYTYLNCTTEKENVQMFEIDYTNIEEGNKDYFGNNYLEVLCDIAKKAFKLLDNNERDSARLCIIKALKSEYGLITRLGLLFLRNCGCYTDSEKARLVLQECDLFNETLKEQLFLLMAKVFQRVELSQQLKVVDRIWNGSDLDYYGNDEEEIRRHRYYVRYNWLSWLSSNCDGLKIIDKHLDCIRNEYPFFKVRNKPELSFSSSFETGSLDHLDGTTDFSNMAVEDAYEILHKSLRRKDKTVSLHLSDLVSLRESCQRDVYWGTDFIQLMERKSDWSDEIWESALEGIGNAISDEQSLECVVKVINDSILDHFPNYVSRLLMGVLDNNNLRIRLSENNLEKIRCILLNLWKYRDQVLFNEAAWSVDSMNTATGMIMRTLIRLGLFTNKKNEDLPKWLKDFVYEEIEKHENCEWAVFHLCAYSAYFYYMDPSWTKAHILPFLCNINKDAKRAAWKGLLHGVSNVSIQFGKELIPCFVQHKSEFTVMSEEDKNAYIKKYVLLIMYIAEDPVEDCKLYELIKILNDDEKAVFAQSVYRYLKKMGEQERIELWNEWIKDYWEKRTMNLPAAIGEKECEKMLCWVLIEEYFNEACDMIIFTHLTKKVNVIDFCMEFSKRDLKRYNATKLVELIEYLAKIATADSKVFWLSKVVEKAIKLEIDDNEKERLKMVLKQ